MKNGFFLSLFVLVVMTIGVGQASATSVDFSDWRNRGLQGDHSGSIVAGGVTMTITAIDNVNTGATGYLGWSIVDGLGVNSGCRSKCEVAADEIDTTEQLLITFSQPVELTSIRISDLFNEGFIFDPRQEIGFYSINGGSPVQFSADTSLFAFGNLSLSLPNIPVTSLAFFGTPGDFRNDFSVRGLSFETSSASTPEPASMMLLGAGLLACGRIRRKRN